MHCSNLSHRSRQCVTSRFKTSTKASSSRFSAARDLFAVPLVGYAGSAAARERTGRGRTLLGEWSGATWSNRSARPRMKKSWENVQLPARPHQPSGCLSVVRGRDSLLGILLRGAVHERSLPRRQLGLQEACTRRRQPRSAREDNGTYRTTPTAAQSC